MGRKYAKLTIMLQIKAKMKTQNPQGFKHTRNRPYQTLNNYGRAGKNLHLISLLLILL